MSELTKIANTLIHDEEAERYEEPADFFEVIFNMRDRYVAQGRTDNREIALLIEMDVIFHMMGKF